MLLFFLAVTVAASQATGDPSMYSIELLPTPDMRGVGGVVELGWVQSPFGMAVTREGHHVYDISVRIEGLPDPTSLGDYTTYVAWATTPLLTPMLRLGEVENGWNEGVGQVAFNKFTIMISAEVSPDVTDRKGRLVLRGMSPSSHMMPDSHLMLPAKPSSQAAHHGGDGWTHPPMHPMVRMIPGMEGLRPRSEPYLPRVDDLDAVPDARPRELVELADGQTLDLIAAPVRRSIHGHTYIMYGFNGQYPGPLIQVNQKSTIFVNFTNLTERSTTVHWHGVRLDNAFDGVPGVTQDPVAPGETFQYRIFFRDAGIYWYHPHHREDIQQDLGLYGNMLVRPPSPTYFNPVNREEILMLDDLLVTEDGLFPFGEERATHSLMGRFGNVFLINGEPEYQLSVKRGEVVRFFLTNVSNTRTFNLSFGDLTIKVVGSDLGKFELETWADSVVIAPAERYIIEVRFPDAGTQLLTNRVQGLNHIFGNFFAETEELGKVYVATEEVATDHGTNFSTLRENADVAADIARYEAYFGRAVDHELVLTLALENLPPAVMQRMRVDRVYFNPVEWAGTMPMMNWVSTSSEVHWILRDPKSNLENMDIDWRFKVGDVVKIRLTNDRDAFHAMQHPFHVHGQRFIVLSQNGVPNENRVWKDTVLLPVGTTIDILLELSNPGRWMAHCHIAEHLEAGMKLVFTVD